MKWQNLWKLLVGMLVMVAFSWEAHCAIHNQSRGARLVEEIISLSSADITARASVVSGFGEKASYADDEISYVSFEGGEIEVVGETSSSKLIADYSNRIAVNDLGRVEISEIMPVTINGIRKMRFVFRVSVDATRDKTAFGVLRKPRELVTLDYLHESCMVVGETGGGLIPYFDCESYVYGVLDGYIQIRNHIPISQRACFPTNIPPWRVLEISEKANLNHKFDAVAGPLLIEALRKKFPCAKQ